MRGIFDEVRAVADMSGSFNKLTSNLFHCISMVQEAMIIG